MCDCCDGGYHTYCLTPRLHSIPTGTWLCNNCGVCVGCGSRTHTALTPEASACVTFNAFHATQLHACCSTCSKRYKKRQFCIVCNLTYSETEYDTMMVQCDKCESWTHCFCDQIDAAHYEAMGRSSDPYHCPACRPAASNAIRASAIRIATSVFIEHVRQRQPHLLPPALVATNHTRASPFASSSSSSSSPSAPPEPLLANSTALPDAPTIDDTLSTSSSSIECTQAAASDATDTSATAATATVAVPTADDAMRHDPRMCTQCHKFGDRTFDPQSRALPRPNADAGEACNRAVSLPIEGRLIAVDNSRWIHVQCAIWSPEVGIDPRSGCLSKVPKAIYRGNQVRCAVCSEVRCYAPPKPLVSPFHSSKIESIQCIAPSFRWRYAQLGATVKCHLWACGQNFHLMCAVQAKCVFNVTSLAIHCCEHASQAPLIKCKPVCARASLSLSLSLSLSPHLYCCTASGARNSVRDHFDTATTRAACFTGAAAPIHCTHSGRRHRSHFQYGEQQTTRQWRSRSRIKSKSKSKSRRCTRRQRRAS